MPGNEKRGANTDPDPDPAPYLYLTFEMKRADMAKPYDSKKSYWVPDGDGGFLEGMLESENGGKVQVTVGHDKKVFKKEQIQQVNPPKFEKCEDMSNLTYLNEASVLHNLRSRYQAKLIYTYSGLFCVAINPYKRYPIYTRTAVKVYLGKRRNEVPPHLFAISDTAYRNMLTKRLCQSILVTGESGAGKTENTKKVISYFAMVGARESKKKEASKVSLEDQIVQTNPILEAFGNAKTARNDNSSRFGKFIRIHFNIKGKLAGCDIETYLLEKARITFQQEVERSYHIFYQMMQPAVSDLKKKCLLSDDIYDYHYVSQGKTKVTSIDDNEDLEFTHEAFKILCFGEEATYNVYKATSAVMNLGELKFKQKGREEQCEPDNPSQAKKVASLLGIDPTIMMKSFCKPKIKVGTEWVTKGQNIDQSYHSVAGIARGLYGRVFNIIVEKCNETLVDDSMKKAVFIGVLDIAGFEIFEFNGFEQLCINFCNEKLQQFFNHHMFVLEQEEYLKEGIDWEMVDFGMDLQSCITMFEKPLGIVAILEEESLFPKATDKTFEEKLKQNHMGKSPSFAKAIHKTDKNAHFAIIHYAGTVSYNVTGWLEKNKDPLNDTVVELLKSGTNKLINRCFKDHPGQGREEEGDKKGKKKKGGGGKTVSSFYTQQLNALMTTLHATEPHFIRCIIPNNHKQPGMIESGLVLHQLTCNGVLEGIRICMRGFPNRMPYPEFLYRYGILKSVKNPDEKKAAEYICNEMLDSERYRIGHTKIFFRAGVLGYLEEVRDDVVTKLTRMLQGECFAHIRKKDFQRRVKQRKLLNVLQRVFRRYLSLRHWGWFSIIQKTRPLIGMVNIEEEIQLLEDAAAQAVEEFETETSARKIYEENNSRLMDEKLALLKRIETEQGDLSSYQERQAKAAAQSADMQAQLGDLNEKIKQEEERKEELIKDKRAVEQEASSIRGDLSDMEVQVQKVEQERTNKDHSIRSLNDEITTRDELINKLNKEKKHIQEINSKASEELQAADEKVSHLSMVKTKLEQTLDELEDNLDRERRKKNEEEKQRRKIEGDLKITQEVVSEMERAKKELDQTVQRKEREIVDLNSKLSEEQNAVSKLTRGIKETQGRVEEMEEELEAERQSRAKAERQRSDLAREMEELTERIEEASGATAAQMELNKKREAEVIRMRKDLEEINIQQESTVLSLKKKHQDAIMEMSEQIDQLGKLKSRVEKDNVNIKHEIEEIKVVSDEVSRAKASADKIGKGLSVQVMEMNKRISEANLQLNDMDLSNKKAQAENSDLLRQLEEIEQNVSMLQKIRHQLNNELEDVKKHCEDESKERQSLMGRFRNLEHEFDGMSTVLEEETTSKENLQRQCQKAEAEANLWRLKFEKEGIAKIEELENIKMKLQARLAECEGTVENLNTKLVNLEKSKAHLQENIDDMSTRVDQSNIISSQMEKKLKQFDKVVHDWKTKADTYSQELEVSQRECRNVSSELFRIKNGYEECMSQLDEVRRENKNLSEEIKDIMEQISEGGRSIHEIEKQRKRLETEKQELTAALEEAEATLEQEENKHARLEVEIMQVKNEIEKRLQEKEEEFEMVKKNHQKLVEQMQEALEVESKAKAELMRTKKKLEADVGELEGALEQANQIHDENQRNIRKYQENIQKANMQLEDEQQAKDVARENLVNAERKANAYQNALEESRTMLEQADRARRSAEQELTDCHETISDLTVQNQSLSAMKRKIDQELDNLRQDIDEMRNEAMLADEKAKRSMLDAAKLAEELRNEQDHTSRVEQDRRIAEAQIKDLQIKIDEVETAALKHGKKACGKLEARIKELENEMDSEQRRLADSTKTLRKSERKIKELEFQSEEDQKHQAHMQDLVDKLQTKLRNFKRQIEEAEEIAALNLAKFRKAQAEAEEAEERAGLNEHAMSKLKVFGRASSAAPFM